MNDRESLLRTTMNIYGDVVTGEMSTASLKVADLAFHGDGAQTERKTAKPLKRWWAL